MKRLKELFVLKTNNTKIEFFRSLFVGAAATAFDYLLLILFKESFGIGSVAAATLSYLISSCFNYLVSTLWVFGSSNVESGLLRFAGFLGISVVGLGLNDAIIWLFEYPLAEALIFGNMLPSRYYYLLGKCVSVVAVFVWNFAARKLLLYRSGPTMAEN